MLGATLMLALLAFFQPFKHPGILSINTGAQMVVLLVLFGAQYLLIKREANVLFSLMLIVLVLTPLVSGILVIIQLPKDALNTSAGDTFSAAVTSQLKMATSLDRTKKPANDSNSWSAFRVRSFFAGTPSAAKTVTDAPAEDDDTFWNNPMHVDEQNSVSGARSITTEEGNDQTTEARPPKLATRAGAAKRRLTTLLGKRGAAHAREIYDAAPRGSVVPGKSLPRLSSTRLLERTDEEREEEAAGTMRMSRNTDASIATDV